MDLSSSLRVGTGLAWWRRRHDPPLKASEVAEALRCPPSTYSMIETGRMLPSVAMVEALVQILGVPPGAMFVPEILETVLVHG